MRSSDFGHVWFEVLLVRLIQVSLGENIANKSGSFLDAAFTKSVTSESV